MATPEEQKAQGNWNQFKGRLKETWGALTDDDVDRFEGRRDQLVGRIQERT
ncbi:MAG: CsbD family protein, partial [Bacteroidota bacterium]